MIYCAVLRAVYGADTPIAQVSSQYYDILIQDYDENVSFKDVEDEANLNSVIDTI